MVRVGITGGIGSGKTIVSKLFVLLGIPVFSADIESKYLLNTSDYIRSKLVSLFGNDIYLPNHTIDRMKLASIIFNNESLLKQVNEIVHPAVHKKFMEWSEKQTTPFVLYEAAVLFENGRYSDLDYNILVFAEERIRIQRVMNRDHVNEEKVTERIRNQWADEKKMDLADFIIYNNSRELIIPQVLEIYKKINSDG